MPADGQIEKQLYPAGDAEFLKRSEEVILHSVLAQVQFARDRLVGHAFRCALNHLHFTSGKIRRSAPRRHTRRRNTLESFKQSVGLLPACPDESLSNMLDAIE